MKKALLFALTLVGLSVCSFAADTKAVEETFNRYWSSFSKRDFSKAAADVLPSDLDDAKAALLPVFLEAQAHKSKEVQALVNDFFGRTVGKARETMSPVDVFAGLNRIATANNPNLFEVLKEASTSIIFVRTPKADEAEVHFQIMHRGASDIDMEVLSLKSGRWWVRLSDDPKAMAEELKKMLAKPA